MSDWTGVYSTVESLKAGLDLEMPSVMLNTILLASYSDYLSCLSTVGLPSCAARPWNEFLLVKRSALGISTNALKGSVNFIFMVYQCQLQPSFHDHRSCASFNEPKRLEFHLMVLKVPLIRQKCAKSSAQQQPIPSCCSRTTRNSSLSLPPTRKSLSLVLTPKSP